MSQFQEWVGLPLRANILFAILDHQLSPQYTLRDTRPAVTIAVATFNERSGEFGIAIKSNLILHAAKLKVCPQQLDRFRSLAPLEAVVVDGSIR